MCQWRSRGQAARNGRPRRDGSHDRYRQHIASARSRRGLELPDCERQTRIRARYLGALEDERFDHPARARLCARIPAQYATFLGLDGRVLVEEYDDRFGVVRDPVDPAPAPAFRSRPRRASFATTPARKRTGGRRKAGIVWLVIGAPGAGLLALWIGAAWHATPTPLTSPGGLGATTSGVTTIAPRDGAPGRVARYREPRHRPSRLVPWDRPVRRDAARRVSAAVSP